VGDQLPIGSGGLHVPAGGGRKRSHRAFGGQAHCQGGGGHGHAARHSGVGGCASYIKGPARHQGGRGFRHRICGGHHAGRLRDAVDT